MNFFSKILLASLLVSCTANAAQTPDKIKLLCNQYPPFSMSINDTNFARGGDIDGINVDIIRELMRRAKINYSLTMRFPYKRLLENTKKRPSTGVFTVNRTPERELLYRWVGPINSHNWVLINAGATPKTIPNINQLSGQKVVIQKGESLAKSLIEQGAIIEEVTSARIAIQRLESGDAQYWASAELPAIYFADQEGVEVSVGYRLGEDPLYLALNSSTPDSIVNKLQQTIDQMRRDGTLSEIRSNYL